MSFSNTTHVTHHGIGFTISDSIANCYTNGELTLTNLNTVAYTSSADIHSMYYTGTPYEGRELIAYTGFDKNSNKLPLNNEGAGGEQIFYKLNTSGGNKCAIFRNTVLLYCPSGAIHKMWFDKNDTDYYIITEFDTYNTTVTDESTGITTEVEDSYFKSLYIDCQTTDTPYSNFRTHTPLTVYSANRGAMKSELTGENELYIAPASVWEIDGKLFITMTDYYMPIDNNYNPFSSKASITGNNTDDGLMYVHNGLFSVDKSMLVNLFFEYDRTTLANGMSVSNYEDFVESHTAGIGAYFIYSSTAIRGECWNRYYDMSEMLKNYATCGMKFKYKGVMYKPVIQNGTVKDYTDNMETESEYDDIFNVTGNNIPVVPVNPFPEHTDSIDDMTIGYTSFLNGSVKYYPMTSSQLSSLCSAFESAQAPVGVMNNVISIKSFPIDTSRFIGLLATSQEIKVAGWGTGVSGTKILSQTFDTMIGSVYVQGYHGTESQPHYLDFSPYTSLEIYIPYCGIVEIPTTCMYKTVYVYLLCDIIDGSCTGIVKCEGNIVAQKTGMIASDAVLSAVANNERFSAMLKNGGNAVSNTVGTITTGSVSSAVSSISAVGNSVITARANYTKVIGTNAGKVEYALPSKCYLKRYRIASHADSEYTKSFGRPVCKSRTLSVNDGLTVVDNYKCNFNATQTEKDEIKALFKSGVIL